MILKVFSLANVTQCNNALLVAPLHLQDMASRTVEILAPFRKHGKAMLPFQVSQLRICDFKRHPFLRAQWIGLLGTADAVLLCAGTAESAQPNF